eukprot:scaffold9043_cov21-Prasinocladus_malaysianus.AAC.2
MKTSSRESIAACDQHRATDTCQNCGRNGTAWMVAVKRLTRVRHGLYLCDHVVNWLESAVCSCI